MKKAILVTVILALGGAGIVFYLEAKSSGDPDKAYVPDSPKLTQPQIPRVDVGPIANEDLATRSIRNQGNTAVHTKWITFLDSIGNSGIDERHKRLIKETVADLGVGNDLAELIADLEARGFHGLPLAFDSEVERVFQDDADKARDFLFTAKIGEIHNMRDSSKVSRIQKWAKFAGQATGEIELPLSIHPALKQEFRFGAAKKLLTDDPDKALTLLKNDLKQDINSVSSKTIVTEAVRELSDDASFEVLAKEYFNESAKGEVWESGSAEFFQVWAKRDSIAAATYLLSAEATPWNSKMVDGMMNVVAANDVDEAVNLVSSFKENSSHDRMAEAVVKQIAGFHPDKARELVGSMDSSSRKAEMLKYIDGISNQSLGR